MRLAFRQTHLYRFVNMVGVARLELAASWSRTIISSFFIVLKNAKKS